MCSLNVGRDTGGVGFLVDTSEIRGLIQETQEATARVADDAARIELLKPAFARLLAADDWLPERFTRPDDRSRMGDGIGQYALYRAVDGSLCLFSLVVPPGVATPVHDHLAWGLVGVYRGRQDETIYRRLDDGSDSGRARLEVAKQQVLSRGDLGGATFRFTLQGARSGARTSVTEAELEKTLRGDADVKPYEPVQGRSDALPTARLPSHVENAPSHHWAFGGRGKGAAAFRHLLEDKRWEEQSRGFFPLIRESVQCPRSWDA